MATWVIHLRIADAVRQMLPWIGLLPELPFAVGNLAPDGGMEIAPHVYEPDSATTHWTPTGRKRDIDADAFYRAYLLGKDWTPEQAAFYLGYYVHLLTDVQWIREVLQPLKQKIGISHFTGTPYDAMLRQNLTYLEQTYCRETKSFSIWERIQKTKTFSNRYLPYYKEHALTEKLEELQQRYAKLVEKPAAFLVTAAELDDFVERTVLQIAEAFQKKDAIRYNQEKRNGNEGI